MSARGSDGRVPEELKRRIFELVDAKIEQAEVARRLNITVYSVRFQLEQRRKKQRAAVRTMPPTTEPMNNTPLAREYAEKVAREDAIKLEAAKKLRRRNAEIWRNRGLRYHSQIRGGYES